MRYLCLVCLVCLLTALAGCATQGSLDNVRNDIDAVKTRLFSVEKDLGGVRDESKSGLSEVEKSYKNDMNAVRKLSADLQATIDSTKSDMRAMTGRIDDLALAVKKPAEDLSRYRTDADKRIVALEDRVVKLQSALDELNKKIADGLQKIEAPATPDALYMKGLDAYKAGDMNASRDIFIKFLEKYPEHDLAANAQYWIGETHFSEKSYEPAILAYQEVIKQYPKKEKVPAAMLKQAMAFKAIGDVKSAKYVLKKLVEGFPRSEEGKKGKELLKELK